MNEYFIVKRLQRVENFLGSFPSDSLPYVDVFPAFYVVNTDKSDKPGSHLIAICENENFFEIYDSLALPQYPLLIKNFLSRKKCHKINRVQSDSSFYCGLYSCFFILARQTLSFTALSNFFSKECSQNDKILLTALENLW